MSNPCQLQVRYRGHPSLSVLIVESFCWEMTNHFSTIVASKYFLNMHEMTWRWAAKFIHYPIVKNLCPIGTRCPWSFIPLCTIKPHNLNLRDTVPLSQHYLLRTYQMVLLYNALVQNRLFCQYPVGPNWPTHYCEAHCSWVLHGWVQAAMPLEVLEYNIVLVMVSSLWIVLYR